MGDLATLKPDLDNVAIGSRLAANLGARVGDVITVINPQGRATRSAPFRARWPTP